MRAGWMRNRVLSSFVAILMVATFVPLGPASAAPNGEGMVTFGRPVGMSFGPQGVRVQGVDRFATSVAISEAGWASSEWVVVATARNLP